MYGGSTGGWEAMAAQVFYPDDFNGAYVACPDPIDFRAFTTVDIYKDKNAYWLDDTVQAHAAARASQLPRATSTRWSWEMNRLELVLGTQTPLGPAVGHLGSGLLSRWAPTATRSASGTRARASSTARSPSYWREHYDLSHILKRDWDKGLGKKLEGKLHIYVGDMDNYYLNNAVYLVEEFLKSHEEPALRRRGGLRRSRRALLERRPRRAPTPTRGCATTRCSCRRSSSGC